ncbi:MAG: hydroxylamine oxidase [Syntrophaceae bacterium]|nr:hydroxylamine oxidase [Syntrophaceae bacterium]
MKKVVIIAVILVSSAPILLSAQTSTTKVKTPSLSQETSACLDCHKQFTPGIVEDWLRSRHSKVTPASALRRPEMERRISAKKVAPPYGNVVVGCYECHGLNPDRHRDNFDHMGFKINVIVSLNDCATCHPVEVKEFSGSKKAHAVGNLTKNPIYHTLVETVISKKAVKEGKIVQLNVSDFTQMETCFSCHGTEVKVGGMQEVETKMGKIEVPALTQWPNQGTGRINPDGSLGACSACHARHEFSIEVARKPYTCAQCHLEPDVPAWNVYHESKHGNIYHSNHQKWNFNAVPWKVGKDFQSPTCATCHNSLITGPDGKKVAERSHDFGSRLWVRLFGLIYSHPQPKHGDTSLLRNKEGLPLPTAFTGEIATEGLLGQDEQTKRRNLVSGICNRCHSTSWVNRHFEKLENTIQEVDSLTLASTLLLVEAWNHGLAEGLPHGKNPFDEAIEQMWIRQWLFYANSVKYASAMTGAPDYATFKNGWWNLTENLQQIKDWMELKRKAK